MKNIKLLRFVIGAILIFFLSHLVEAAGLEAARIRLRVAAEQANVREKPDIMSPILKQLPLGATLEAERKEGEWYAVRVEKDEGGFVLGYVHESLVVVVETRPEEPPQKEPAEDRKVPAEPPAQKPVEPAKEEPRFLPPPAQPVSTQTSAAEDRPAVIFWLGGRYASVGDMNEGAKGLARYYEDYLATPGEGDVKSLHYSYLLGVEARFPLAFGFHLSLGAEYGSGKISSSVLFKTGIQEVNLAIKPRVRTIPISLSLVYYPSPALYLKAGVEYTFAQCGYTYRLTEVQPDAEAEFWQEWTGEANSSGFGAMAALGYDWNFTSAFSLTAEIVYRHSRLGDFGGEDVYKESSSYESVEKGKLYYFRVDTGAAEAVPLVFIRERRPSEAGVLDVRKAEVSLSGFSLKIGIKVRL